MDSNHADSGQYDDWEYFLIYSVLNQSLIQMKNNFLLAAISFFIALSIAGCGERDMVVEERINNRLHERQQLMAITATFADGVATLSGDADSEADKESAEAIARQVKGVDSVINKISTPIVSDQVHAVPPAGSGLIADETIMDSTEAILKNYPGVNASVSGGTITLTGTVDMNSKDSLISALRSLHPVNINDQLSAQ